jgi:glycosyltransferase involved in cell wall biosynthesis
VATNIRGSREEVVEGETGFLVPVLNASALAGALRRLVDDAAMRARFGAAGRSRALDLYDESEVVRRQLDVLGLSHI